MKLVAIAVALLGLGSGAEAAPCTHAHVTIQRVDDSSPLPARMFAFAGKDKAATDAGVTAELETWRSGGKRFTTYYLTAKDRGKLEAYVMAMTKQTGLALEKDHAFVIEKLVAGKVTTFRTHYVTAEILVDDKDFASVEISSKQSTAPAVVVTLTDTGKAKFAAATKANVDHKLAVIVDDSVADAPVINSEVAGGKFAILNAAATQAEHSAEAKRLADALDCKP